MSFWAANVGTETSGSILSPSNQNMLVGIKPTVGRVSRYGVIPIAADQDTPGPMARSVADAAIMLGAMEGAKPDPNDPATSTCTPPPQRDYTRFLRREGLKGARIGIPRAFYYNAAATPGERGSTGGLNERRSASWTRPSPRCGRRAPRSWIRPTSHRSSTTDAAKSLLQWPVSAADQTMPRAATRIARWCSSTG